MMDASQYVAQNQDVRR